MKINPTQTPQTKTNPQLKAIEDFSKNMESVFTKMMLDEMYKTVPEESDMDYGHKFYKNQLIDEYAKQMTETNSGLGIRKLIYQNITKDLNLDKNTGSENKNIKLGTLKP